MARGAAYRAAHPDKVRASIAAHRAANREKLSARAAAYRAANRDAVRASKAAHRAANLDKVQAVQTAYRASVREKVKAWDEVYPLLEKLLARVSTLEALIGPMSTATVDRIAPERPRRKRAVHEHVNQAPVLPSATPPIIRTIKDIISHDGVTPAEAKRIQDGEILARAEWRPTGNA